MECKWRKKNTDNNDNKELIETLWNVNTCDLADVTKPGEELIETLWNVNVYQRRGTGISSEN